MPSSSFLLSKRFIFLSVALAFIVSVLPRIATNPTCSDEHRAAQDESVVAQACTIMPGKGPFVHRFQNNEEVGKALAEFVHDASDAAIKARGKFTIALSGGSMPAILHAGVSNLTKSVDFDKWEVFFADERCVALDSPDSNYKACYENFLQPVGISESHIHKINPDLSPEEAAKEYADQLIKVFGPRTVPAFDLILLGMGPDGHTASLFPGHPLLQEHRLFVAPISDSPKPPPERITLTYPILNNAVKVAFVATGSSKAPLIPQVLGIKSSGEPLPAARVQPTFGTLHWFVDEAAASEVPKDHPISKV